MWVEIQYRKRKKTEMCRERTSPKLTRKNTCPKNHNTKTTINKRKSNEKKQKEREVASHKY
jgi:hypothetical protein